MTILHFKVVLAAIFIKININNRKTRPYSQFYSLVTSKYVPLKVIYHPLYGMNNYVLIWGDVTLSEGYMIANHPI